MGGAELSGTQFGKTHGLSLSGGGWPVTRGAALGQGGLWGLPLQGLWCVTRTGNKEGGAWHPSFKLILLQATGSLISSILHSDCIHHIKVSYFRPLVLRTNLFLSNDNWL